MSVARAEAVMDGRIGWWPHSQDGRIASVRIRCLNPMAELRRRGCPVELYDPERPSAYSLVILSKRYDRRTIEQVADLKARGVRVVFDLCDNHFYNPHRLEFWREAGERLRRMLTLADVVTTSTPALAEVIARESGRTRAVVIGDGLEEQPYCPQTDWWTSQWRKAIANNNMRRLERRRIEGRTLLVWFGNHGSPYADGGGMLDLLALCEPLAELGRRFPLALTVISNHRRKFRELRRKLPCPSQYVEWEPSSFYPLLAAHDIALIPVAPNPFTRCKTNNRLALALHLGLAAVATGIPSYRPFAGACRLDDFHGGLRYYLEDPARRGQDVARAAPLLRRLCSPAAIADQWQRLIDAESRRSAHA